jgi:N-acetylglucosamine-6-sulfatase
VLRQDIGHQPRATGQAAVSWMKSQLVAGQPFFLMWAPMAPHAPSIAEPQYATAFPEITDPLVRARRQTLLTVDDIVRVMHATLKKQGQLDNTYILITSDNGWLADEHGVVGGKNRPWENSVRVGLFARGPGIAAGSAVEEQIANIDIASTILDMAGLPPLSGSDGLTFLPLLDGSFQGDWREKVTIEGWLQPLGNELRWRGWRSNTEKFFEWSDGKRERYDLVNDPDELVNLEAD